MTRLLQSPSITLHNFYVISPLRDVISGMIMAATSVPQLIAYAETAGYAGYRGLTTAGPPPLAAWGVATGHPYMNAGVTSITAIMTQNDLQADSFVAQDGEQKYVELMPAYSACISIASVVLAVSGFGRLALNVPKPVLMGFKWDAHWVCWSPPYPIDCFYRVVVNSKYERPIQQFSKITLHPTNRYSQVGTMYRMYCMDCCNRGRGELYPRSCLLWEQRLS